MEHIGEKIDFLDNQYGMFWIEDDILMEIFKPSVEIITLDCARLMVEDRLKVSNGVTMALFVDLNNARDINADAREYFSKGDSLKNVSACAMLLHNYIHWLGARLFLSFYKMEVKIQVFRTKKKAIEWLCNYKYQKLN